MQGSIYKVFQTIFDLEPILFDSFDDFERYRASSALLGFICDFQYSYVDNDNIPINCYLLRRL